MFALLAAVVLGLILNNRGIPAVIGVLCLYALLIFLFFLFSERFKDRILKIVLPAWYGNLIILFGLVPLLFVLSFWISGVRERQAVDKRAAFEALHEADEKQCILSGRVKDKDLNGNGYVLHIVKCKVSGYFENVERSGGGCLVYVSAMSEEELPRCGDTVRVYGNFYFIKDTQNPGEYDKLPKSLKEDVHARVIAKKMRVVKEQRNVSDRIREGLCRLRFRLEEGLTRVFDPEDAGILMAMITGNRNMEDEDTAELYRRAGIGHILAISGLHVSLLALGLWKLLKKLTCGKYVSTILTTMFLLFFIIFTGASVSTLRAGGMCLILLLGRLCRKHYDPLSGLAAVACLILLVYPWEIGDPSFLLSFTAIVAVYKASEVKAGVLFGFVISLFTAPVIAFVFFEIPTYSFITNLLVIPLTGVLLLLGIFSGLFGAFVPCVGNVFGGAVFFILRFFEAVSEFTSNLPFSLILTGKPQLVTIVIFYALWEIFAGGLNLYGKMKEAKGKSERADLRKRMKRTVLLFGGGIAISVMLQFIPDTPELTFLSVGQGDCSVFTGDRTSVLFDCGSTDQTEVGSRILSPFMKSEGLMLLDKATVSHTDADHVNGIIEILEKMNVYRNDFDYRMRYNGNVGLKTLVLPVVKERSENYGKLLRLAKSKNVEVVFIEAGEELQLKDRRCGLTCLSPLNALTSENETSLVFFLKTPEFWAFLMGDAGHEAEQKMLERMPRQAFPGELNSSGGKQSLMGRARPERVILKVGHHGSRTATSEEFLKFISPSDAVISCGRGNVYGHPHESVLSVLKAAGVTVHRTDKDGAVVIGR